MTVMGEPEIFSKGATNEEENASRETSEKGHLETRELFCV